MPAKAKSNKSEPQSNRANARRSESKHHDRSANISQQADPAPSPHTLHAIHQTHGNQAVHQLVTEQIQPRLSMHRPDNASEREAKRVSRRMLAGSEGTSTGSPATPVVRRRVAGDGQNHPARAFLQRNSGEPLDSNTRAFFEPRFGHDFGNVRVHTGTQAAAATRGINAHAYTIGHDMVFARGKYAPETSQGRRLLTHELTHVVQQHHGRNPVLQRAIKSVTAASEDGWLTVRHANGSTYPPLPEYLRVNHTDTEGGRDQFTIVESGRNGALVGEEASVTRKPDGGSYLTTGASYSGPASVSFNQSSAELRYGSRGPVRAITDPNNPIPEGTHNLEIPYEAHPGGGRYTGEARYAKTWFRVGHSGDRFLHTGNVSAGCATVQSVGEWDNIYQYLITSRTGDTKSVGEIEVTSTDDQEEDEDGDNGDNGGWWPF